MLQVCSGWWDVGLCVVNVKQKGPTHMNANRSRKAPMSCPIVKSSPGRVVSIDVEIEGEVTVGGGGGTNVKPSAYVAAESQPNRSRD